MAESTDKKLTFQGFLMNMAEEGTMDSEGVFTVAAEQTVEKLRQQFSGDPWIGFVEILQGFQQLGAERVEIGCIGFRNLTLSGCFSQESAVLEPTLEKPLEILAAGDCLQSGTGLTLLEHDRDEVYWTLQENRQCVHWKFERDSLSFEPHSEPVRLPSLSTTPIGKVWLRFTLKVSQPLSLFTEDRTARWRDTFLSRDFANRFAFYGRPLFFQKKALQCPLPGRLVPEDAIGPSPVGGSGYSWVPLAFDYKAATPGSSHYFLSEPFTGTIGYRVEVEGRIHKGFGDPTRTRYVRFRGHPEAPGVTVPFRQTWWRKTPLTVPGFQELAQKVRNPAVEPASLFGYAEGRPLKCSRIMMLSTAMKGPSHLVFVKHGVVLGARAENLGVPGALCLVGMDGLSTDLSRRVIRLNEGYRELVAELRQELHDFTKSARRVVGF